MEMLWGILIGVLLSFLVQWLFYKQKTKDRAKEKTGDFHQLSLKMKDLEIRVRSLEDQLWK
jgi:hypothetical protein